MKTKIISTNIPSYTFKPNTIPQIIGMLHVVGNNILVGSKNNSITTELPQITDNDWKKIQNIHTRFNELKSNIWIPDYKDDFSGVIALSIRLSELDEMVSKLSFMNYLVDRSLSETDTYLQQGVNILQFENVGAPYAVRNNVPLIDQLIVNNVAGAVRKAHPTLPLGIQMLAFADNIALEIAHRNKLFYVRGESFLFHGIRPEGPNPNDGNLLKAYYMRNYFNSISGQENRYPLIFPDLIKKHTIFTPELTKLEHWLHNIQFMKLEGAIITGAGTGEPVNIEELKMSREYLINLHNKTGQYIPLFSGSGTNKENLADYMKYVDGVILGSSIKQNGNWELPLDHERLKTFMDEYRRIID